MLLLLLHKPKRQSGHSGLRPDASSLVLNSVNLVFGTWVQFRLKFLVAELIGYFN